MHRPPAAGASVVLDIGGDIGAVVCYAPESLVGTEVPIYPSHGAGEEHTHALVWGRLAGSVETFAAVYPALPAGEYRIAGVDAPVVVRGGVVTETSIHLPPARREKLGASLQVG